MVRIVMSVMLGVGLVGAPINAQVYEELQVVLRDTRFHVIDKDGFPVKGLTRDDFTFSVGKQPLDLTSFEEVDLLDSGQGVGTPDAQPLPKRNIVLLIDTSNMDRRTFDQLIPGIEELIQRENNPETLIKIVQLDQRLTHLTPFTNQLSTLERGLEELEYQGWFRQKLMLLERQIVQEYEEFRTSVESGMPRSVREFNALNVLNTIDEKERAKLGHFSTFYANTIALARILAPMPGDRSILYFTGGLYLESRGNLKDTYSQLDDLSKMLNNYGITIFSFLHNSPTAIGAGDWQSSVVGHVEQYAAMRELYSYSPFRSELDAVGLGSNNALMENTQHLESGPLRAAELTGGFYRKSSKSESLPFDVADFFDATQHYYRITYTIEQEREKKNLKISLKNRELGYRLQYGRQFKPFDPMTSWSEEEMLLNFEQTMLYRDVFRNDLDADTGFRMFIAADGSFVVPVFLAFTMRDMPVRDLETGFALFDRDRQLLDVVRQKVLLSEEAKKPLLYQVLISDRTPAFVRFFARDLKAGDLTFLESSVSEAIPRSEGPQIWGLTVGEATDRDVILLHRYQAMGEAERKRTRRLAEDPFFDQNHQWVPPIDSEFDRDALIPVFFQVTGAQAPLAAYTVIFKLRGAGDTREIPGQLTSVVSLSSSSHRLNGVLQLKDVPAGAYVLTVILEEASGTAMGETPITVR